MVNPMQSIYKYLLFLFCALISVNIWAQKDTTETLETERLIIVTPYSPTVSDAVKIRQNPKQDKDSKIFEKQEVKYDIYSVPVASTFTPEKGKVSNVQHTKGPKLYDSYAAFGIGNYTNILAEFYTNLEVGKGRDFQISLNHYSSQGGIKNLELNKKDKYYNTDFGMAYKAEANKFYWGADAGFLHQQYNWYGIFDDVFSSTQIRQLNPAHNYRGASVGAFVDSKDGIIDKISFDFRNFGDDFHASENRFKIIPEFNYAFDDESIKAKITFDYLNGKFRENLLGGNKKYSYLNLGVHPSYNYDVEDWAVSLGAELFYSSDVENKESKFFVHPKLKASYRLDEYLSIYGGIGGGLKQNNYYDFTQNNPFVAPALTIAPTHTQYDFYGGAKGILLDNLDFDVRAGYKSEKGKAMYKAFSNTFPAANSNYTFNNSFVIAYDNVKTFYVSGGLNYEWNADLKLGMKIAFNSYGTKFEDKAWNLPNMETKIFGNYLITDKWTLGGELFYMGKRKDEIISFNQPAIVNVNAYVDANLNLNFQASQKLGFFLRGNNLFNGKNKSWYHYPTQGFQVMLGASYQF